MVSVTSILSPISRQHVFHTIPYHSDATPKGIGRKKMWVNIPLFQTLRPVLQMPWDLKFHYLDSEIKVVESLVINFNIETVLASGEVL
jgi:hypothetical protein